MPNFTKTIELIDGEIAGILAADAPCSNKEEGIESHAYYEDIPDGDKERIDTLLDRRWSLMPDDLKARLSIEYEALLEVIINANR